MLIADDLSTKHVQNQLFHITELDPAGGYWLCELGESERPRSSHAPERLLIDANGQYALITILARVMGIPDNLVLAQYIHNLEMRINRLS